jgi:hypothetical protein
MHHSKQALNWSPEMVPQPWEAAGPRLMLAALDLYNGKDMLLAVFATALQMAADLGVIVQRRPESPGCGLARRRFRTTGRSRQTTAPPCARHPHRRTGGQRGAPPSACSSGAQAGGEVARAVAPHQLVQPRVVKAVACGGQLVAVTGRATRSGGGGRCCPQSRHTGPRPHRAWARRAGQTLGPDALMSGRSRAISACCSWPGPRRCPSAAPSPATACSHCPPPWATC